MAFRKSIVHAPTYAGLVVAIIYPLTTLDALPRGHRLAQTLPLSPSCLSALVYADRLVKLKNLNIDRSTEAQSHREYHTQWPHIVTDNRRDRVRGSVYTLLLYTRQIRMFLFHVSIIIMGKSI